MANDIVLDISGVTGESKTKGYEGKIDVLAWSWGLSNSGSFHAGGGGGTGKPSFQDISLTKQVDLASPILMLYCANGKHFDKAKLVMRKSGGDNVLEYVIIELEKVLVSSYSTGASGGEDRPTENVSLNFAQVKVTYWSQSDKGAKDKSKDFGWKIPENVKL